MKIREYKKSDEKEVKKLILSVLKSIYGKTKLEWGDLEQYLKFYIAEENGKIIGTLALKKVNDNTIKLKRMYVQKTLQGKGIGTKLFDKAIKFSKSRGFKRIILTTYPEMIGAIKFYEKHGFKIIKNLSSEFFTDPKLRKDNRRQITMERNI